MEQPIIRVGNAVSKIECDRQLLYKLDTATAVEFPGAEYARRHRPLWDGRWHPVDPIRGTFPTGMLTRIRKIIPIARVIDERVRPPTVEYNAKILKDITFADHQEKAIKIALDKARGILALAVNAGKCVASGMRLTTSDGRRTAIEQLQQGDCVFGYDRISHDLKPSAVKALVSNGLKDCVEVITKRGHSVIVSHDHPFLTGADEWTHAEDLKPGMLVGVADKIEVDGNQDGPSSEEALLLGFYLGDGNGTNSTLLRFSVADATRLETLKRVVKFFGDELVYVDRVDYRVRRGPRGGAHRPRPACVEILERYGLLGKNAHEKFVPSCIFSWPKARVADLLSAYLGCDGSITMPRGDFSFTSVSKSLAEDIRDLLLRFGVFGKLRERHIKYTYKGETTDRLAFQFDASLRRSVSGLSACPPLGKTAALQMALAPRKNSGHDRLPLRTMEYASKWRSRPYGIGRDTSPAWNAPIKTSMSYLPDSLMSRGLAEKLGTALDDDLLLSMAKSSVGWDVVKEVRNVGLKQTWDIEIEDTHSFLVENFVTHNTEVGIAIASHIAGKCIWIVHRKDLLHQTSERIKLRTGQKAALFGDGCWDDIKPDQKFVIIMPQTVQDELRYFCDLVKDANVIMLDEAHRTGAAATWYKVTQAIPAFYRIGLTGTPETGDPVRDLRLEAATGPIIDQVKTKDLQAIGWSSKCKVMYHKVENESVPPGTPYMDARRMLIEENPNRNAEVVSITMSEVDVGRRCLIICDTIRHARIVAEILRGENVRCKILTGKHSGMIRSQARKDMRSGALEVIVATPIFDEGVDLPELEVVVLAAGGKSAVRVLQRIGRALRIAPGKTEATIHDFIDTGSKYTFRHSMDRVRTCRKEGFNLENAPDTDRLPKHATR